MQPCMSCEHCEQWRSHGDSFVQGHSEVMQMLRQFGAQVDVANKAGWTPLHRAAYCGFADTCEWLLNSAVSMHAVNK